MAGKSDPSIYDDRATIGSSDELDEYGVWVKSEPQDLSGSLPEIEELPDIDDALSDELELPDLDTSGDLDLPDFSDEPDLPVLSDSAALEFEEIPESSDLPDGSAPISIDKDGFTEVSMDDFLDSTSDLTAPESIDFGDLDNSVAEIEPVSPNEQENFSSNTGQADLSTQLLQRIADELSSIKKEISSLKTELSIVRGEVKGAAEGAEKGFFDEEDDEKIALTGDELDNILNTANFTEETGSNEGIDSDLSFDTLEEQAQDVVDSADTNFAGELAELDSAVKVEDEVKDIIGDDFDIALDLSPGFDGESSELDILREEGASPITSAPEDTSYLEEDPLVSGEAFEEQTEEPLDFSGAVIDEPDLSAGIMENPVSEPAIDNISIDLEMEEASKESGAADDFVFETEETLEIPDTGTTPFEVPPVEPFAETFDDMGGFDTGEPKPAEVDDGIPSNLKQELKTVLSYMDQLLESLPEEKIEEFAKSEYFDTYKKLFEELGLV